MCSVHPSHIHIYVFIDCNNNYVFNLKGGFGSYLLGLNKKTYEQAGIDTDGNSPGSYKELGLDWMIGFLFVVSFVGLLALVPLRRVSNNQIYYYYFFFMYSQLVIFFFR